jgi:hypothetical protein
MVAGSQRCRPQHRLVLWGKQPIPPLNPKGGSLGLPADFLIATDGRVLACKYGSHAFDQWSVDEILATGVGSGLQPNI